MKQHFMMFAAYNQWANTRIYDAAADLSEEELGRDVGAFFGSMLGTLNHLLVTDRVWMKRFTGEGDAPSNLATILYRAFPG
ncbi:MAG: damage-inducible protein DinB, partial [Mesorhizobium sp.]